MFSFFLTFSLTNSYHYGNVIMEVIIGVKMIMMKSIAGGALTETCH